MTRRALLAVPIAALAHGTHASRTLMEFIPASGELQITVTIPAADLEEYLRFATKRQIELDRDKDAGRILHNELRQWLQLQDRQGRPLPLRWVGLEAKAQTIECYVETKTPKLEGARVRNTMLIGWTANWVNQVIARNGAGGPVWSYQFHQGKTEFAVVRFM
jgi:hypothetical protein